MLDGTYFYSGPVAIMILAGLIYFFYPFNHNQANTQRPVTTCDTPPQPVTPPPTERDKVAAKTTTEKVARTPERLFMPTGIPTPPSTPRQTPTRRKPSITALITNILPSRRGSLVSPFSAAPETPVGEPPVINRSKEEIEGYGDFPDYASLSGVRLPNPYPEFKIEKALPRPYRPFRWSYHQTMGMLHNVFLWA